MQQHSNKFPNRQAHVVDNSSTHSNNVKAINKLKADNSHIVLTTNIIIVTRDTVEIFGNIMWKDKEMQKHKKIITE